MAHDLENSQRWLDGLIDLIDSYLRSEFEPFYEKGDSMIELSSMLRDTEGIVVKCLAIKKAAQIRKTLPDLFPGILEKIYELLSTKRFGINFNDVNLSYNLLRDWYKINSVIFSNRSSMMRMNV
jgi:hypothetical protein